MSNERFEWYYLGEHDQLGPLSESQITDLAENGVIVKDTLLWKVGMEQWAPAESFPKLATHFKPQWTPPPVTTPPPPPVGRPNTSGTQEVCPRDGSKLNRTNRSGIEIEWCPQCKGVWLDRGELDKIIEREATAPARDRAYKDRDDDKYRHKRKRDGFFDDLFDIFD